MSELERFKSEASEQDKQAFRAYMEEREAAGEDLEDAAASYLRARGYDVTARDCRGVAGTQEMSDEDLDAVNGGRTFGGGEGFEAYNEAT